ncbi:SDR family NAD(P)-dependent oxidoreductase [Burkholderia plantarii]|uniref:SDR family NAD(P)-dependent oxidoreductase n=2 Tax=Burkholderia plantarii TaxID=41899 RepID=UPI0006D8BA2D|nr:SDR family NAD(P)-dependent oxidoreductase [Burkholderia plantarii]ALK30190.1 oxidoreductase / glycosyl transferase fusion protein [Burkholderia plantarii]
MSGSMDQTTMRDPLTQYPRPDFEKQPQPAPGLAREMHPKPDHGETSYRGTGRLKGRRALITGADSGIGRAVAIAFAREGASLALNYLHSEEADAREVVKLVEDAGRQALALPGDIADEAFCRQLVTDAVDGLGGLDILVNGAGRQVCVEPGEARPRGCFIGWPDARPESERYLALMEALGARAIDRQLAFPLQQRDRDECAALVAAHGLEPERLVLIHPGARLPSRRWPAERFAAVADNLAADGWQIAITGTTADAPFTGAVLGEMAAPALHLTGLTSLGGMAALVARARLVVCNDTGISRIAAAVRTACVVVVAGSDTRRPAPPDRALADYPPCRPCQPQECPHDHACAHDVSVEQVVGAACAQLDRVRGAVPAEPNVLHTAAGLARAAREWHHAA